ncbi:B-cadherin-like isoform X1 [Osmerus mordax]|uniref:B-cadherin-like isoform X1 n=1 Tax=Osmerus mordax TaxID=8014 RepID=UPI00350EA270
MRTFKFTLLGVLFCLQAFAPGSSEESACQPGFEADMLIFKVERRLLQQGRVLGKVGFDDCTERKRFWFNTEDKRFRVESDGTVKVKREVALHSGHKDFSIHVWDSLGRKMTVTARVVLQARDHHGHGHQDHHGHGHQDHHGHGHQDHHGQGHQDRHGHKDHSGPNNQDHHGHKNHNIYHHKNHNDSHPIHLNQSPEEVQPIELASATPKQAPESSRELLPVLFFPKAWPGLKRQKRAWVIPPISFPENDRGPFPKPMVQIRSDSDKEAKVEYQIEGPGADQPPVKLFTIDKNTGQLYVTRPLDRENQDKYMLKAIAKTGNAPAEAPMDIIIYVIDQNDNKPVFPPEPFLGNVPEASSTGFEFMQMEAKDADEPGNANSDIRYKILSQDPPLPNDKMFAINPVSGQIRVQSQGLDREKYPKYTLEVQAADLEGEGLIGLGKAIITVTDSNDNAPQFEQTSYTAEVPENVMGAEVVKMQVTDLDDPHSEAWTAVFRIVDGDPDNRFNVTTGPSKQEGIITTVKELDFERVSRYTLLVTVVNAVPFASPMPTATATVVVTVKDVNEAPVFSPVEKLVVKKEGLDKGSELTVYTATDPDTARKQTITYKIQKDLAGWLSINKDNGQILVKNELDRESHFVVNGKYTALIAAVDNDDIPATGTGTLLIQLEDVNDNAPIIMERSIRICNKDSVSHVLSVTDKDGPTFAAPYKVSLQGQSEHNWTASMNDTQTGIILSLATSLAQGDYTVVLRVEDNQGLGQVSTLTATVCDCTGADVQCSLLREAGVGLPGILGILGAILLLLLLVLLLLMFMRRRKGEKKEPLLQEDDIRDNIYYYDEEGGGEDDQDYDLSVLHRGLDNRPDVFRNDVEPTFMPAPTYRPRPANPEDIGNFIVDNLKAADNDPTAPPYDSLLVFDYEGGGSEAGSLSSLNSSSSDGDYDYDLMQEWGPRFKKLADMYGGGEEEML